MRSPRARLEEADIWLSTITKCRLMRNRWVWGLSACKRITSHCQDTTDPDFSRDLNREVILLQALRREARVGVGKCFFDGIKKTFTYPYKPNC